LVHIDRYIKAATKTKCLYCPVTSATRRLRVISMSLYGSERRYIVGAIRNAQLAPVIFPGWQIRFYCKSSGSLYTSTKCTHADRGIREFNCFHCLFLINDFNKFLCHCRLVCDIVGELIMHPCGNASIWHSSSHTKLCVPFENVRDHPHSVCTNYQQWRH